LPFLINITQVASQFDTRNENQAFATLARELATELSP
jgi:hypothetical protein